MQFMLVHLPEEEKSGQLVGHVATNKFKFSVYPEFEELAEFVKIYEKKQREGASTEKSKQPPDVVSGRAVTSKGPPQPVEEAPTLRQKEDVLPLTPSIIVKEEPGEIEIIEVEPIPAVVERAVPPAKNIQRLESVIPDGIAQGLQENGGANEGQPAEEVKLFCGKQDELYMQEPNNITGMELADFLEVEGFEDGNLGRDEYSGMPRGTPELQQDGIGEFPDFEDVGGLDQTEDLSGFELNMMLNGEDHPEEERNEVKEKKANPSGSIRGNAQTSHRRRIEVEDEQDDEDTDDDDRSPIPKRRRSGRIAPPRILFGEWLVNEETQPDWTAEFFNCPVVGCKDKFTETLEKHMLSHPCKSECRICRRQCSSRADLRTHYRKHTGERPYGCDTCPQRFPSRHGLKEHQRRVKCHLNLGD